MSSSDSPRRLHIDEVLDDGSWSSLQKWMVFLAALACAVDGLANMVLGLAIPALIQAWAAEPRAFASVAAMGLIGVAIGAIAGGMLGDYLGRRFGLIASVAVFGAATLAASLTADPSQLMWVRFIDGLGIGAALPNATAFISEFTPARHRPVAIALGMVFIPVGGFLAGLIGTAILPTFGWKGLFLATGTPSVLLALLFLFVLPESPRYLVNHPARHGDLKRLLERCGHKIIDAIFVGDEQGGKVRMPFARLLGPGLRADTMAIWIAFFFCLLGSYSVFSWVPTMLKEQGFNLAQTSAGMTTFNFGGMAGGLASGWLIQRLGSRSVAIGVGLGGVLSAVTLGILPLRPEDGLLVPSIALVIGGFFVAGLTNTAYTLAASIYPSSSRATGVGAAAGIGRIGAVLSSYTGVIALELGGASSYFIVIAAALAISFIAAAFVRNQIGRNPGGPEMVASAASQSTPAQ